MLATKPAHAAAMPPRTQSDWTFQAGWATDADEVRAAQRLRFAIFAGEMGAQLPADAMAAGLDCDRFDAFCDHLLVWAVDRAGTGARQLAGTYRLLTPACMPTRNSTWPRSMHCAAAWSNWDAPACIPTGARAA